MTVCSRARDPARVLAAVLLRMPGDGIPLGDIIDDSGPGHLDAQAPPIPLRRARAELVQDLHPHDPAPGAHTRARSSPTAASTARRHLARCSNSRPCHPQPAASKLRGARPAGRRAGPAQASAGTVPTTPTDTPPRHPPRHHRQDPLPAPPGLHAAQRDLLESPPRPATRPPAAPSKPSLSRPGVAAKTRQKHDYPSPQGRLAPIWRRTAERVNATIKDTATTSIARGWCRLMGLAPLALWIACLLAVRNQRILTAFDARQDDNARRAAAWPPAPHPEGAADTPSPPRHPQPRGRPCPPAPAARLPLNTAPPARASIRSNRASSPDGGRPGRPKL